MNGYEGMCMSWGEFSKPSQVTDKIIESIFVQTFMNDSNSKNNNLYGFKNLQMDIGRCV